MLIPNPTDKRLRSPTLIQLHRADDRARTGAEILLESLVPLRLDTNGFQRGIAISCLRFSTFLRRGSVLRSRCRRVVAYLGLMLVLVLVMFTGSPPRRIPPPAASRFLPPRNAVKVIGSRGLGEGF